MTQEGPDIARARVCCESLRDSYGVPSGSQGRFPSLSSHRTGLMDLRQEARSRIEAGADHPIHGDPAYRL